MNHLKYKIQIVFLLFIFERYSSQVGFQIKLLENHQYDLYQSSSSIGSRTLILDKNNFTYFYKFWGSGELKHYATSKGIYKIEDNIITLDTFQPDMNCRNYNYNEVQPDYFGNYITPKEKKTDDIEIHFSKDLFYYNQNYNAPKIFVYENNQTVKVSPLNIDFDNENETYCIRLDKEKLADKKISFVFYSSDFLLNLSKIKFQSFYINEEQYPRNNYVNMTNLQLELKSKKLSLVTKNKPMESFNLMIDQYNEFEFIKQAKRKLKEYK